MAHTNQSSSSPKGLSVHEKKHPNDVVVTLAIRSPLCRARKGGFKDTRNDELMTEMIKVDSPHLYELLCFESLVDCHRSFEFRPSPHRRCMCGNSSGSHRRLGRSGSSSSGRCAPYNTCPDHQSFLFFR
jgi:hypothetical protein